MRTELKEGLLRGAATVLLLSAVFWSAGQTAILVNEDQAETEDRFCVVIDAGHGGVDPGKVGMNGELEKELNLQIAEKLKLFLEASDVEVVMTRTTDTGLYDENAGSAAFSGPGATPASASSAILSTCGACLCPWAFW